MKAGGARIAAVAIAAAAFTGIFAGSAAAQSGYYELDDPTGVILGPGGGLVTGTNPGREWEGGICNNNTVFMPGYYYMYFSSADPPGNADSNSGVNKCPSSTHVGPGSLPGPEDLPVQPPEELPVGPDDLPVQPPEDLPVDPDGLPVGPDDVPGSEALPGADDVPDVPGPPSTKVPEGYQKVEDPTGTHGEHGGIVVGTNPGREAEVGVCDKSSEGAGYSATYLSTSTMQTTDETSANCAGDKPVADTLDATSVTSTTGTLNGTVNANRRPTKYYWEAGLTTSYGSQSGVRDGGRGGTDVAYSLPVSGLASGTTYHYRIVAFSAAGTAYGDDVTFTTPAA